MKTILTTLALGLVFTLSGNQLAKSWGYEAVAYQRTNCNGGYTYPEGPWGFEAVAYQRTSCNGNGNYSNREWGYPRYFEPNCRLFCRSDFLGNLYNCKTKCF